MPVTAIGPAIFEKSYQEKVDALMQELNARLQTAARNGAFTPPTISIIVGMYKADICQAAADKYKQAGWKEVKYEIRDHFRDNNTGWEFTF